MKKIFFIFLLGACTQQVTIGTANGELPGYPTQEDALKMGALAFPERECRAVENTAGGWTPKCVVVPQ